MYLPRPLLSHLYLSLLRTHHPLSPPVLILCALDPDALCACRILTTLLKRDYIPHKIQPVAGYADLARVGATLVAPMRRGRGGEGGVVVCLGVGGGVDLGGMLGLGVDEEEGEEEEDGTAAGDMGGVEVWVVDSRRPWNLGNVFGGTSSSPGEEVGVVDGEIQRGYRPGRGGIIVFDDGDVVEELGGERTAYCALVGMPEVDGDEDGYESDGTDDDDEDDAGVVDVAREEKAGSKRKSWSDREDEDDESDGEDGRPRQRRRSNSSSSIASPRRPGPRGLLIQTTNANGLPHSDDSRFASPSGRSPSPTTITAPKQPSVKTLRRRLIRLRRSHEEVLRKYYELGASYSEPVSSLLYSLASELGREDNDLLWLAIVGVSSLELYGRDSAGVGLSANASNGATAGWGGTRGLRIRQLLRDEVRRLNPPDLSSSSTSSHTETGIIPTTARSPTDTAIRLSPEPKFLLIRHWSLYDSMLHSPFLASRLRLWSEAGRKRLHKLLAKMGVSLVQCRGGYVHMDVQLKRGLRERLGRWSGVYGLEGLVPPADGGGEGGGFVRCWGWKACLSAGDVGVVVGALLEVGRKIAPAGGGGGVKYDGRGLVEKTVLEDEDGEGEGEEWVSRFWEAYDALEDVDALTSAIPLAQHLHRAILRTGTALIEKKQIRHLRAFRMCVVREGPDVTLFTHPAALTKLALWVGEAVREVEGEEEGKGPSARGGKGVPLVVAGLNERRGVYVVVGVGTGGGAAMVEKGKKREERKAERERRREEKKTEKARKRRERAEASGEDPDAAALDDEAEDETEEEEEDSDASDSDPDDEGSSEATRRRRGHGRNRFGNAFQEVVAETGARVRIDSFEHCVVEVKKEDLAGFLEGLSARCVVG